MHALKISMNLSSLFDLTKSQTITDLQFANDSLTDAFFSEVSETQQRTEFSLPEKIENFRQQEALHSLAIATKTRVVRSFKIPDDPRIAIYFKCVCFSVSEVQVG